MTRLFEPIVDELCDILRVSKPGDLPKVVRELKKQNRIRRRQVEVLATVAKLAREIELQAKYPLAGGM